jgi:hypothetical protein
LPYRTKSVRVVEKENNFLYIYLWITGQARYI